MEQKVRRSVYKGTANDLAAINRATDPGIVIDALASCTLVEQVTPSFLFRVHLVRSCSFLSYNRLEAKNLHCGSVRWSLMSDIRFRSSEQSLVLTGNTGTSLSRQRFRSSRASSSSRKSSYYYRRSWHAAKNVSKGNNSYEYRCFMLHIHSIITCVHYILMFPHKDEIFFFTNKVKRIFFSGSAYIYQFLFREFFFLFSIYISKIFFYFNYNVEFNRCKLLILWYGYHCW